MKTKLINRLLWRYKGLLKEVISQKTFFKSSDDYIKLVCKISMYINVIQTIQLNDLCSTKK